MIETQDNRHLQLLQKRQFVCIDDNDIDAIVCRNQCSHCLLYLFLEDLFLLLQIVGLALVWF